MAQSRKWGRVTAGRKPRRSVMSIAKFGRCKTEAKETVKNNGKGYVALRNKAQEKKRSRDAWESRGDLGMKPY